MARTLQRSIIDDRELVGQIKSFRFASDDTGWAVANVELDDGTETTAVGPLAHCPPGEVVAMTGSWDEHPQYGPQWKVESVEMRQPQSARGFERYLETVPGIGPEMATRIVERFGGETLQVVWDEPDRLAAEIDGIGPERAKSIREHVLTRRDEAEATIALRSLDVPAFLVPRILHRYGGTAATVIRENPYRLYRDIDGIGFKLADRIAAAVGIPRESGRRIVAGIDFSLNEAARRSGHCYLTESELMSAACAALELRADTVRERIPEAEDHGVIIVDGPRIYRRGLHRCECDVAQKIAILSEPGQPSDPDGARRKATAADECMEIELSEEQIGAVALSIDHPVSVITGGPGVGKSTITRAILAACENDDIALCSPTGRAAKRLSEATGRHAKTIHRTLEYHPELGWRRNAERPLEVDLVLVDEVSMVDIALMSRLVEAIPRGCRLILVGDVEQLPSVGPGRVLGDLIASGAIPVARLTRIYRQGAESRIVPAAHGVLQGIAPPRPEDGEESDLHWMHVTDPERLRAMVVRLVADSIPSRYGLDAQEGEAIVLTPMHKGPLGTKALNEVLRERLNPPRGEREGIGGFRAGDRVMQTRNDYDLGVFNGDLGRVLWAGKKELAVEIDGNEIEYTRGAARNLQLAYATTIHKMQGNEVPAVVLVTHKSHWIMLRRPLLYTGMTRASRLLVLAGDPAAAAIAASTEVEGTRNTALAERIRDLLAADSGGRDGGFDAF